MVISGVPWHSLKPDEIYARLDTGEAGLAPDEAARRLKKYGPNALRPGKKPSPITLFFSQFNNFLIYLLVAATVISLAIGETIDASVIAVVVLLNAALGFMQEYKAERSIEALGGLVVQKAIVARGGRRLEVPAPALVPGDIIEVEAGVNVPADCRLVRAAGLKADESALTGESEPAGKHTRALPGDTALGDMDDMLFMGTSVTDGRGLAVVVGTGMDTEIGKIAKMLESGAKQETPMQASIGRLGTFFGAAAVIVCIVIFVAGWLEGQKLYEMFLVAVSLAVAAIPEGLPATITVVLALGVRRMARKRAIIRKLPAVETLGSASVICSDKTGTLTQNIIVVRKIITAAGEYGVTGAGYSREGRFLAGDREVPPGSDPALELLLIAGALCNNATFERLEDKWNIVGDSTEVALLAAASKAGFNKTLLEGECPRIREVPFHTDTRRMSTVNACGRKKYVFAKGAPEAILALSTAVLAGGNAVALDEARRKYFSAKNDALASGGMRVLGLAYKEVAGDPAAMAIGDIEGGLVYLGLAGMMDPPRPEAKGSIRKCKEAGIGVVMVTGDQKPTALAIAGQLGIYGPGDIVVTGAELNDMAEASLDERIERIKVYARTSPEQKLRIVEALERRGEIVAMTGDGVNDAPALKRADIGIAMGATGTDIARQAADMVLMDDNFATIVSAVEEGRRIYDNAKNAVKYLFSGNVGEVLTVFLGILLGLPLPLLAIQILWVNLITDSLPALALSLEPASPDIMKMAPRPRSEGIFTKLALFDMALIGIVIGAGTLGVFYMYLPRGLEVARTMAFTALVIFQVWNCLNCRSGTRTIFDIGPFGNKYLLGSIALSVLLQCVILYVPYMAAIFNTVPPSIYDWIAIAVATSSVFILVEARKLAISQIRH